MSQFPALEEIAAAIVRETGCPLVVARVAVKSILNNPDARRAIVGTVRKMMRSDGTIVSVTVPEE